MLDQAAVFLRGAGQKAGHVDEGDDRDVEGVAKAHEARRLAAGVAVEHAGQHHRLIGDHAHGAAGNAAQPNDDVAGEGFGQFEEIALVQNFEDQFLDVVRFVWVIGYQSIQRRVGALGIVERRPFGGAGGKIRRQKIEQPAHLQETLHVVVVSAVGDRGFGGVHGRAAKLFGGDDLVGHGFDHVGPVTNM